MRNKVTIILLALLLSFGIAGCKNTQMEDGVSSSTEDVSSEDTTASSESESEADDDSSPTTEETSETTKTTVPMIPEVEDVYSALNRIDNISSIEATTREKDSNRILENGGVGCLFFRVSDLQIIETQTAYNLYNPHGYPEHDTEFCMTLDEESLFGEPQDIHSPIDVGTSGGGSIEIYNTEAEAIERDQYLASLDYDPEYEQPWESICGWHEVHGTYVIRLSSLLTPEQKTELMNDIIDVLP
ncbi:MAG: hypothetical protein J6Z43_10415 [Clostridiales bacterium]|nr:hypothetical protein [Clostridiales bacterium]